MNFVSLIVLKISPKLREVVIGLTGLIGLIVAGVVLFVTMHRETPSLNSDVGAPLALASQVTPAEESEEAIGVTFELPEKRAYVRARWSEVEETIRSLKGEKEINSEAVPHCMSTEAGATTQSSKVEMLSRLLTDKELKRIKLTRKDKTNPEYTTTFQQSTKDIGIETRLSKIEEAISRWSKGKQATSEQK